MPLEVPSPGSGGSQLNVVQRFISWSLDWHMSFRFYVGFDVVFFSQKLHETRHLRVDRWSSFAAQWVQREGEWPVALRLGLKIKAEPVSVKNF